MQERVLRRVLARNAATAFGRAHGFAALRSVADFQRAVPVGDYEAHRPWIERAAAGEPAVLTADPVRLFERSSGTASASKLIPYTAGLQEAFNRALHPWVTDVWARNPGVWGGPAYWVITPLSNPAERTSGGLPVGFAADAAYFGGFAARLIGRLMAVPEELRLAPDLASFRYLTLLCLLRATGLRLISLWSPSFLPVLLEGLADWAEPLCRDLHEGTARGLATGPGLSTGPNDWWARAGQSRPDRARARDVARWLAGFDPRAPAGLGERLWPRLALISTWMDGEAAAALPALRAWFPTVAFQGKGLLATEGAVTIPLGGAPAPVLAVTSAFFEFREGEEGETPVHPPWDLEEGACYRVVMTTPGGLYRYELNDIVQVAGRWGQVPCLRFLGKEDAISDLCGEKLHARHVGRLLERWLPSDSGAFLAPRSASADRPAGYDLFLPEQVLLALAGRAPARLAESVGSLTDVAAVTAAGEVLAAQLEAGLRENFHYDWCRQVGQLDAPRVVPVPGGPADLRQARAQRLVAAGGRLGTVKFPPLTPWRDWDRWFPASRWGPFGPRASSGGPRPTGGDLRPSPPAA